jgi:2-polyprenyl-6-methoxyphenol hydroxylase-like FAD-dependent oxidoreductase
MGIHDAVVAASTDMQGAFLVDKNGRVINEMIGDAFGHRVGEDLEIVRGTLCQILMDHIPDAEFIFGDSIRAISQSSDRVQVEFTTAQWQRATDRCRSRRYRSCGRCRPASP